MHDLRHITSINDLSLDEIETVFSRAQSYLRELGDPNVPHRIGRSITDAQGSILATLFYEPSTRTRLSFETAMLRLGGKSISSADPATSSAAKGESLADTVRVASNYADVLVIRHPRDGAAKLAASYASVPVINGGDGAHEHPTQTLCDLFTLLQEGKKLQHLNVAISGDLKGSRTIHSFVYALARFGANILMMPAKGMELPSHVDWRLRNELNSYIVPRARYEKDNSSVDALYMTADKPHQLSLIADANLKVRKNIDAMYVTRFQKERWTDKAQDYPTVDQRFLRDKRYSKTSVLHPLPRVGELDIALDSDRRAAYFRQAAFGVPIRMALIASLLGFCADHGLKRYPGGFRPDDHPIYDQPNGLGIDCANKNCIVHDPQEGKYTRNRFYIIGERRLRCFYCETDVVDFVVANKRTKHYESDTRVLRLAAGHDTVIFSDAAGAEAAGFSLPKRRRKAARVAVSKFA
jgi:aspartate carbamoyltransferase catalytic subunit